MSILVAFLVTIVTVVSSHRNDTPYNRSKIEALHPGFGRNWTVIYDGNDQPVVVFFDNDSEERLFLKDNPSENNVILTLYTKSTSGETVTYKNVSKSSFNPNKKTKFLLHGWMSNGNQDTCVLIKDNYIANYDFNVIIVDWGYFSRSIHYYGVVSRLKQISQVLIKFVMVLLKSLGVNPEDIHFIGHSLGAQLSGYVGKTIGRLGRITGLDPALPGFDDPFNRLNRSDAKFVDIVHTCGGFLGILDQMGTVDFYPNGGSPPQPGCEVLAELTEACSHGRSWKYYAESLRSKNAIWARKCRDAKLYKDNAKQCGNVFATFGEEVSVTAAGPFYLTTSPTTPYLRDSVH